MLKNLYLLVALISFTLTTNANVGDTTWVQATHVNLNYYNNFDTAVAFPTGSNTYRKIYMICTLGQYNCPAGSQYCHQWDYDIENIVMTPTGDTLEISRFVTPFATSGTPGFGPSWQQHYIFDVTDFYPVLKNSATLRAHYSGYSGGFTLDTKFAFIEGTPERNVLGISPLWNRTYTFGDQMNVIDSNLKSITKTPVAGTVAAEMKVTITGHGADSASGCCEFDYTGAGHGYTVVANNAPIAQTSMNVNCGSSELYPQGGTWASARAGAWCPGGLVTTARYRLPGATTGIAYPVDLDFDNSYDGLGHYGVYIVASSMFYYGAYNKSVDASVEDIIAPTNFEGYRRENPRASEPVVKIRNTGSAAITTMLIEYGVQDSIPQLYIFNGSLSAGADTVISLPAVTSITSLSLGGAAGLYNFNTKINVSFID